MNLFIDTNVFLDFYHLSGADIEELNKLTALLEDGSIKLFVPSQLCEEFKRNRDSKIMDAMLQFRKIKFKISFPAFCKLYPEYSELQNILTELNKKHAALYEKAMDDVNNLTLKADTVIADLFDQAVLAETDDAIYERALRRFRMGNPPGKKKSTVGDEINWECLLEKVPHGEDIYLVSGDADYASPINSEQFNPFLQDEWNNKKGSNVAFYTTLQAFFKENYPDIKLASDVRKAALIKRLAKSGSFATTHVVIGKLDKIDDFTSSQVEELIQIADMNNQVRWIIGDSDVHAFYTKLKEKYKDEISEDSLSTLAKLLSQDELEEDEDNFSF